MKLLTDILNTNTTAVTISKQNTNPVTYLDILNASYTYPGLMASGDKQKLDLLPLNQLTRQSHTGFPRSAPGLGIESGNTNYAITPKLVQVVGSYAYMCPGSNPGFLCIYDVSDKVNVVLKSMISVVDTQNNGPAALFVEPTGRYVYITMASFNINIVDTINKSAPVIVNVDYTQLNTGSAPWGLRQGSIPAATFTPNAFGSLYDCVASADNKYLYTVDTGASGANCASGLFVFDITNVSSPVQKWNILQSPNPVPAYGTISFTSSGGTHFSGGVTSNNSVVMFSSSTDANVQIGIKYYVYNYSGGNFNLFTALNGGGTQIIPIANGTATLGWRPISVAIAGNTLFVVEFCNTNLGGVPNNCRLILYDVTNVASAPPVYLGSVAPGTNGALYGVTCSPDGNWAYVSVAGTGIWYIINCTNKASPVVTATMTTPNSSQVQSPKGLLAVDSTNKFLWVLSIASGQVVPIWLYDISNPANPVLTTTINIAGTNGTSNAVAISQATSICTLAAHGLANGESIDFTAVTAGMGINTSQQYWVVNSTTNTFQLALSSGGAPISFTGTTGTGTLQTGSGVCYAYNGYLYVANRALNTLDIYTTLSYAFNFGIANGSQLALTEGLTLLGVNLVAYKTNWLTADGATKVVTHNLNTNDIWVNVYDAVSGESIQVDTIVRTTVNSVTLTANQAPGSSWRILIRAC